MMAVAVKMVNRAKQVTAAYERASRLGMDAAANLYEREVKRAHGDHYTSQAFRSTLSVRQSIRRTKPMKSSDGWYSRIGTKLRQPLYWELGHRNIFIRDGSGNPKFVRREIWKPVAIAQAQAIRDAYARVVSRILEKKKTL
jgi:hypothetical protein